MEKAVELAIGGAPLALKLCLERLVPIPQDRPVQVNLPSKQSEPNGIVAAHNNLLASVSTGDITPQEAQGISALLEARRRSWESADLADQLNRIEQRLFENKSAKGRPR